MNCPFLIATRAKRPSPALERPIRRWRDGDTLVGMRLYCGIFPDADPLPSGISIAALDRDDPSAGLQQAARFESVPFARAYRETVEQRDSSLTPLHALLSSASAPRCRRTTSSSSVQVTMG